MNSPESIISRILKIAVSLVISAYLIKMSVCIIASVWKIIVLIAFIIIGLYVASKASVLKKALETNDLSIERKEGKIRFPWFTNHGIDGEAKAYMQLVSGIAKRAKMLTRVTATESVSDNEKFTMRLFLVSLNFKGEEYKFARKFLLRNLSGNSSWRTEDAKARHDTRKVQQEIEAPEVTIERISEGGEDDAELPE